MCYVAPTAIVTGDTRTHTHTHRVLFSFSISFSIDDTAALLKQLELLADPDHCITIQNWDTQGSVSTYRISNNFITNQ